MAKTRVVVHVRLPDSMSFFTRSVAICVACGLALVLASSASAQNGSLYLAIKGGATTYGGEIDQSGTFDDPQDQASPTAWLTRDFGPAFGLEAGYQFSDRLSLGLTGQYARYINLDEAYPTGDRTVAECRLADESGTDDCQVNQGETLPSLIAAFRFRLFGSAPLSPFVNAGAQLTFGNDDPAERPLGVGPYAGLGLDFRLSRQLSLTTEANLSWIFDDTAVDGVDPAGQTGSAAQRGAAGDDADYDNLGFYSIGLRYRLLKCDDCGTVGIEATCSAEMVVNQSGTFTASVTPPGVPATVTWDWGDDTTPGRGMTATHTYGEPGTYTVTVTAEGDRNTAEDICVVTVPPPPPERLTCEVSSVQMDEDQTVTYSGTVNRDAARPVSLTIIWGNEGESSQIEVASNGRFTATHRYAQDGTYQITATASNRSQSAVCEGEEVVVRKLECPTLQGELQSVTFDLARSDLSVDARRALDSNIEQIREATPHQEIDCPRPVLRIEAYTDLVTPREGRYEHLPLSMSRAETIRDYYRDAGTGVERIDVYACGLHRLADKSKRPGEQIRRIGYTVFETDAQIPVCPYSKDKRR